MRLPQVAGFATLARPEYGSGWDAVVKIYALEGLAGFFKGVRARMMVHTPSTAIAWSTYEFVKSGLAARS